MIQRFFNRAMKARAAKPVVAASIVADGLTPGRVVWAVGDIHGRLDLLDVLLGVIVDDARADPDMATTVVFLGDYIDRGPDSRGVIDRLIRFRDEVGIESRFLKGNHEAKMLEFLGDPTVGPEWCEYGGTEALKSFGLNLPTMRHRKEEWSHLAEDLDHHMTPDQRAFLEGLELSVTLDGYFFAHAGARPGTALDEQDEDDLMWIRGSFLDHEERFSHVVVHGHTPKRDPHTDHRRIGVDTKAYASGVLTAVRLEATARRFVQVAEGDDGTLVVRDHECGTLSPPSTAVVE